MKTSLPVLIETLNAMREEWLRQVDASVDPATLYRLGRLLGASEILLEELELRGS